MGGHAWGGLAEKKRAGVTPHISLMPRDRPQNRGDKGVLPPRDPPLETPGALHLVDLAVFTFSYILPILSCPIYTLDAAEDPLETLSLSPRNPRFVPPLGGRRLSAAITRQVIVTASVILPSQVPVVNAVIIASEAR
jgi:hypothetical protein